MLIVPRLCHNTETAIKLTVRLMRSMDKTTMNLTSLHCTVNNVKEKLWGKWEIPPEDQILMFRGLRLLDTCTLSECDIQTGSILELIVPEHCKCNIM